MAQELAQSFVEFFQNKIPDELIIFLISLLPILELRGGMIAAYALGVKLIPAFIICYIGNLLPIPFILLFIRKIFQFLKRFGWTRKLIEKIELRSMRKSDKVEKYREWGLLLFVAIPLPGTGGWTGALISALLDLRIKKSFPIIMLGVFIAGVIMSLAVYGVIGGIATLFA